MLNKIKPIFKFLLKSVIAYTVLGFIVFAITIFVLLFSALSLEQGFKGRKVLLKQTDFPELLKAGRELINKAEWRENTDKFAGRSGREFFIPEDVNIPETILTLRQNLSGLGGIITIHNDGSLGILFSGSRDTGNFGVNIFPEDVNESANKFTGQDDIMIIPGMIYFDNAYHEFPKLREENLSNIKKNKSLKNN